MTCTNDLTHHPRLSYSLLPGATGTNRTEVAFTDENADAYVCYYWEVTMPDGDRWRYQLSDGQSYSHCTEQGCKLMIVRHLVDLGVMGPSEDNAHLDPTNAKLAEEIQAARESFTDGPRIGDFVIMPDNSVQRCCNKTDFGMQTSHGGRYHVSRSGTASMSGGLNRPRLDEYFQDTGEVRLGQFWFFSHLQPGAGQGVDVYLPCRVYRLVPFTMTEDQARAHGKALRTAEVWGKDDRYYHEAVAALCEGRA